MQGVRLFFKYFPELLAVFKTIGELAKQGVQDHEIRKRFKAINSAFEPGKSQSDAARELDDAFRGRK